MRLPVFEFLSQSRAGCFVELSYFEYCMKGLQLPYDHMVYSNHVFLRGAVSISHFGSRRKMASLAWEWAREPSTFEETDAAHEIVLVDAGHSSDVAPDSRQVGAIRNIIVLMSPTSENHVFINIIIFQSR